LIAEPSSVDGAQGKLSATIVHILFPDQVKHLRTLPCWPPAFEAAFARESEERAASSRQAADSVPRGKENDEEESSSSEQELFENTNHVQYDSYEESGESEEEDNGVEGQDD
jgi:hypothetical protein